MRTCTLNFHNLTINAYHYFQHFWTQVSNEDLMAKRQLVKQRQLASYESAKAAKKAEEEAKLKSSTSAASQEVTKDPGFMSKLIDTIINNFQLSISNVHIRYEDVSNPDVRYYVFFTMFYMVELFFSQLQFVVLFYLEQETIRYYPQGLERALYGRQLAGCLYQGS